MERKLAFANAKVAVVLLYFFIYYLRLIVILLFFLNPILVAAPDENRD